MTIKEVNEQLKTASHPVAKALHKGDTSKVLVIGFKNGMNLKEHKAHLPSKINCIIGQSNLQANRKQYCLEKFDEVVIPTNVIHSVEAVEDSLCLLT